AGQVGAAGAPDQSVISLSLTGRRGEATSQLGPRADAELAVDANEVGLDRLAAEEQGACHLLVREAAGDELCHLALGWCQLAARRGSTADAAHFAPSPFGPEPGPELLEDRQRRLQRLARRTPALPAAPCRPQG